VACDPNQDAARITKCGPAIGSQQPIGGSIVLALAFALKTPARGSRRSRPIATLQLKFAPLVRVKTAEKLRPARLEVIPPPRRWFVTDAGTDDSTSRWCQSVTS